MKAPHGVYLETIERMEPDITPVDLTAAAASIAISLRRIADALDPSKERSLPQMIEWAIIELQMEIRNK